MLSRMCNIVFCCGSWTKFVCRRTVCVLNALHKSRTHNSLFTVLPARAQTLLPATALLTGTQEATASIILSNSWQTCNKCSNGIALPDVSMFVSTVKVCGKTTRQTSNSKETSYGHVHKAQPWKHCKHEGAAQKPHRSQTRQQICVLSHHFAWNEKRAFSVPGKLPT